MSILRNIGNSTRRPRQDGLLAAPENATTTSSATENPTDAPSTTMSTASDAGSNGAGITADKPVQLPTQLLYADNTKLLLRGLESIANADALIYALSTTFSTTGLHCHSQKYWHRHNAAVGPTAAAPPPALHLRNATSASGISNGGTRSDGDRSNRSHRSNRRQKRQW